MSILIILAFWLTICKKPIYTLKERRGNNQLAQPMVGKGKRWLLNIQNEDGTKVEFTEAHTIR